MADDHASPGPPNPAAERPWAAPNGASAEPLSRPARHLVRIADALPDWVGSVRFRLTALYSLVLFGLALFMVAGIYAILASRLDDTSVYRTYDVTRVERGPAGIELEPVEIRARYQSVEELANERALTLLRSYSLIALVLLFLASLAVGWLVAGRVLAPIGRITAVARDIQATDLSRRISLRGPPDELTELADTFDAMLARLDDAFASQQRFIQEASHELRNPLAVVRTNLDVVLADPDPDPDELRRVAELARTATERMSRLIDDLMVYARQGAPAREVVPVRLDELAAEAVGEFRALADARQIDLRVQVHGEPVVAGDRLALRQALANLLANAVRLAPSSSTITVRASTAAAPVLADRGGPPAMQAVLAVDDEGPGIAPEDRPYVFERFWRGDRATARQEGRSGLGLAIVAQVARDHGGTATVDANASGGSTFAIVLPAAPVAVSDPSAH